MSEIKEIILKRNLNIIEFKQKLKPLRKRVLSLNTFYMGLNIIISENQIPRKLEKKERDTPIYIINSIQGKQNFLREISITLTQMYVNAL